MTIKHKKHKGKWINIGINEKQRRKIYEKLRSKAKTILIHKHKKEYKKITKILRENAFILNLRFYKLKKSKK